MAKLSVQGFLVQVGSDRPGLVLCSCVLGFLGTGGKMSSHPDEIQGRGDANRQWTNIAITGSTNTAK